MRQLERRDEPKKRRTLINYDRIDGRRTWRKQDLKSMVINPEAQRVGMGSVVVESLASQ